MALPAELVQTTPGNKLAKAHRDCRRRYPPHDLGIPTRAPLDTEGWLRRELLVLEMALLLAYERTRPEIQTQIVLLQSSLC
jgi:hypothetical protein